MKNVLYIVSTLQVSGPTNIIYNIIKEIDRSKFTPIILCLSSEGVGNISAYNEFQILNIEIHSLCLSRIQGFFLARSKIIEFCKNMNIDVIHLIGFRADILVQGNKFSKYLQISSVFSNFFDDYTLTNGYLVGRIMAHLHLFSIKSKIMVSCSEYVQAELEKWVNNDFIIIKNSVSPDKFSIPSKEKRMANRKLLGIDASQFVFIFVGVLIKRKDPLTTIKAFIESNACKNGTATLIVLGDGPLRNICENVCIDQKSVFFTGFTAETLTYLQASDYYISSSLSEGLPTSVVEALSCGLVPILTKIPPHVEITKYFDKWNYLFEIRDNKKLTELIDKVICEDSARLSLKSRTIVETELNSKIMSDQYQSLYSLNKNKSNE